MSSTNYDEINKIWYGPKNEFRVNKSDNFGEIVLNKISIENLDRVVQINFDTGESLNLASLRILAIRCAQNLIKFGCSQNDRIVIIARNHHYLSPLVLAALCIGTPVAPLDVFHVSDGLLPILQRIAPTFIFCDVEEVVRVDEMARTIGLNPKIFLINGLVTNYENMEVLFKETGNETEFKCATIIDAYNHIAVISCSSGSTGLPKSVLMSHALFNYAFLSSPDKYGFRTLSFSSIYWFSGLWSLINPIISKNIRVFTAKNFTPTLLSDIVKKQKVEFFSGPPSQIQAVFKNEHFEASDLESLKVMILIGSYLPSKLIETVTETLPKCILLTAYGMTEIGGGVTFTKPNELQKYPETVGCLLSGSEIKILNELSGEKSGPNEKGEILVKIPIPCLGYYKDDQATKNAIDKDGFFVTGDVGYIDSDGFLFIVGRKKEIFKNCGYSIWPNEIENVLVESPEIQNAVVTSVYDENNVTELPAAVVVKQKSSLITEQEIYSLVADRFENYKHLSGGVYFVESLPMTPSDKVIRSKAKEIAQQQFNRRNL